MYTRLHDVDLPFQILEKFRRQLSTGDGLDSNCFTGFLFVQKLYQGNDIGKRQVVRLDLHGYIPCRRLQNFLCQSRLPRCTGQPYLWGRWSASRTMCALSPYPGPHDRCTVAPAPWLCVMTDLSTAPLCLFRMVAETVGSPIRGGNLPLLQWSYEIAGRRKNQVAA